MSVKLINSDNVDLNSRIDDSIGGEAVPEKGGYDYVDSEKVKYDIVDNNLATLSVKKNCCVDNVYTNEINDNVIVGKISSDNIDDVDEHGVEVLSEKIASDTVIENKAGQEDVETKNFIEHDVNDCNNMTSNKRNIFMKKKRRKILNALADGDIEYLKQAAISRGGLISDDIRRLVWPKLVGVDVFETSPRPSKDEIENHPYYRQVVLDVNRSLKRFPPSIKETQRLAMLDQLVLLIMRVLCRHPEFHYYQGYHDICVTFLLVLGEETAYYVVERLSRTHLRVFMEQTMEPTIELLSLMYPLISKKSSQLSSFLLKSDVGVAYCISWLITWFGHVLNDYDDVVRLFDFFIVSHSWMPMYLTSVVVLHRESEVLEQECDMACVHSLLSRIPDDLPFEDLILQSLDLYAKHNPKSLAQEYPFVRESKLRSIHKFGLVRSLARTIKSSVPASNFAVPLVIAAAVLVTAVIYQACKY